MEESGKEPSPPKLLLTRLSDGHCPCITRAFGRYLAEAASVCLHHHDQILVRRVEVVGDFEASFLLRRLAVSDQMSRTLADLTVTTELGAVAIAILLVEELTEYQAVYRSATSTGIDYWLADQDDEELGLTARLESSGLLDGGEVQRKRRIREKLKQTERSDATGLPVVVVVVDFRDLVAEVAKRS